MSGATPKAQAKQPINLDMIIKFAGKRFPRSRLVQRVLLEVHRIRPEKNYSRLDRDGFILSRNDRKIVLYGQLLTALQAVPDLSAIADLVEAELQSMPSHAPPRSRRLPQQFLFE